jgi:hypothetical protein
MPYAIVRLSDEAIVRQFNDIPKSLQIGKRRVVSPVAVGDEGLGHRFVEVVRVTWDRPGPYYTQGPDTAFRSGNVLYIKREWTAWTQAEIDAYEAQQGDALIDELLAGKLGKILFALAKADPMPNLTPTQFRNYVKGL